MDRELRVVGWLAQLCPVVIAPAYHAIDPVQMERANVEEIMGLFDKAKDLADQAGDLADKAKDVVAEHGDKLPGGLGDKAKDAIDKVSDLTDKLPGKN